MSTNTAVAKPGCGCGGNGSSGTGAGCGCSASGSGIVPANLAGTGFVRPKFFAGQLLTEDDLSALTAYTIAKDRLHNRHLFGAGVVCGLRVSCDPCGGGAITVNTGYALDCCGNDLVLPCAATLDVNAMIRDLRAAQLGKDCGDPCAGQGTATSAGQDPSPVRRYCLYARYGEQETDPVAPYATGEPCGQVTCEPSRVREGITFVLKCPSAASSPDDLRTTIAACLPGPDVLGPQARLMAYSEPMTAAVAAAERPPAFGPHDAEELTDVRAGLAELRAGGGEEQVRSATEHVRRLAALIARHDLAGEPTEYKDIDDARGELSQAAKALADGPAAAGYGPLDQLAVKALLEQATQLADPSATLPRVLLAMLAQGRALDDSVLAAVNTDAAVLLEWLLDRLDNDPALADCELRSQAQALSLTTPAKSGIRQIRSLAREASDLTELVARAVRDCICAAFDPPCAPCEDTDVLLACLEVRDCTVVRICNAERDYVISGPALRYWLPTGLLRQFLELFCCPLDRGRDAVRAEPGRLAFSEAGFGAGEPGATRPWDVLGLPDPADMLREVMESSGAPRAAPAVPRVPPPANGGADADAAAQQVAELAGRVTELTKQLLQSQARLDKAEATLGETQAGLRETRDELGKAQTSLSALGSQSQAAPASSSPASSSPASPSPASSSPASPSPASPSKARPRPRRAPARRPAAAEAHAPADAGDAKGDAGEPAAGSEVPEASDDT
jgi:hypothetical protein